MDFGGALIDMSWGLSAYRRGWKVRIYIRTTGVPGQGQYLFYWTPDSKRVKWDATHEDLLAKDWEVA